MIGSPDMEMPKNQPEFLKNQKLAVLAVSVGFGDVLYIKH